MSIPPDQRPPMDLHDLGFEAEPHNNHHDRQHDHQHGDNIGLQDSLVHESLQHLMDGNHENQHHDILHAGLPTPDPLFTDQQRQQQQQQQSEVDTPLCHHQQQQLQSHQGHNQLNAHNNTSVNPESTHNHPTWTTKTLNANNNDLPQPPPSKKQRRRYDNNFKAKVLQHLKIPGIKIPAVAKQFNIPENTVREWTKVSSMQAIEAAQTKNTGQLKANVFDPMHRLTMSLTDFFEQNEKQPQHIRQPITTKLVVKKGLEVKKTLLELDQIKPFLDPMERKALKKFTCSDSWAKKFVKRHNLKMTGARIKDLSEEDLKQLHHSLKQIVCRVKQAGPRYNDVTNLLQQAEEKLCLAWSAVGYNGSGS